MAKSSVERDDVEAAQERADAAWKSWMSAEALVVKAYKRWLAAERAAKAALDRTA